MFLVEKVIDIVDHAGDLVLDKLKSGFTVSQRAGSTWLPTLIGAPRSILSSS